MKKNLFILIALLIATISINAQDLQVLDKKIIKKELKDLGNTYKKVREIIYVLDSTKNFNYDTGTDEWIPQNKEKYLNRHDNGRPQILEGAKFVSDEWINTQRANLFYDYSYGGFFIDNLDSYLLNVWDANTLSWRNDTALYFNYTQYFDAEYFNFFEIILEDELVFKNWNRTTNQYTGGVKDDFTLVSDSLYSEILGYDFNTTSNEFDLNAKTLITYNEFNGVNKITFIEIKAWDGSDFINSSQTNLAYVDNNMIQSIKQHWNTTSGLWENVTKITKTYDASNFVSSEIIYNWDGSTWEKYSKTDYINDLVSGKVLSREFYYWNSTDIAWVGDSKNEYTYSVDNLLLTNIEYTFVSGAWVETSKNTKEYNTDNEETLDLNQNWDGADWVNNDRKVTSFNVFGDIEEQNQQTWDASAWKNSQRTVYNYDIHQNLETTLFQYWVTGDWENNYKDEYYWSEFDATIIEGIQNSYYNIFPNPTSDVVNINNQKNNISSITITNVAGKVVYKNSKLNSKNNLINMKQYGNGIYLINIIDVNGNEINSKILVK